MHDIKIDPEMAARRRGSNTPKPAGQQEVGRRLDSGHPAGLDAAGILQLQRVAGNATVVQMLAGSEEERLPSLQRESAPEEPTEEEVQG